ncbi:MAG TPA: glutaminyl-peptide cyclotransferase [Pyrinomonadaceae bacterium]|jgi:glutamine cyclotransferase|nr:glutaminyl-peptide cyclotransferase [Pyrinomonadaceae bacterium]
MISLSFISNLLLSLPKIAAGCFVFLLSIVTLNCQTGPTVAPPSDKIPIYGYEILRIFPHDSNAFTQGLVFHDGNFLESTGEVGHSSLRRVEMDNGNVLQKVDVAPPYFAEGITLLKGKIYQLTWQHQLGFVYDALTFEKTGQFKYAGEGWGLANDGQSLILSDGTNRIRFLNPDNFEVTKTIAVLDGKTPVAEINELEYVQGEIYANIWHADRIARIDPNTGKVVGWINLAGLLKPGEVQDEEAVLNGIAYDEASGRLFITGKLWPKIFEIRLTRK